MTATGADRLDDQAALTAGDPAEMLRVVATSAAQVRTAHTDATGPLAALGEDGRPRAVVVTGMGGSAMAGEVLGAAAGPGCPVPIVTERGYGLPGWVGAADLVIAVSCSGRTEETLSAMDEAIRRGCRLVAVGAAGSPLAGRAEQARAPFVAVPQGREPRASLWSLALPLIVAGRTLRLLEASPPQVEAAAVLLEQVALRCRPDSQAFVNPAKTLALDLAGAVPMVWGSSPLAAVAAARFGTQLAENAKSPCVVGVLPEANHNQVMAFDGPFGALAGPAGGGEEDLFRDRAEEPDPMLLRLVLLRDSEEHPQVAARAAASRELAERRGIGVSEVVAEGRSELERLASLIGLIDFASVYLALLGGIDPTPVTAITELKETIAR